MDGMHEDTQRAARHKTYWAVGGLVVIAALLAALLAASLSSQAATRDSTQATDAQLAGNTRDACVAAIRDGRNAEVGNEVGALLNALVALANDDDVAMRRYATEGVKADARRHGFDRRLKPENLNRECGPPITSRRQLSG